MQEKLYQISGKDAVARLNSRESGLTPEEVRRRQEEIGYNELAEAGKKSVLRIFAEQWKDFLVMILIVAAIISAVLGDWESMLVILIVLAMNAVLGTVQQVKADQSLESLKQLSAPNAKVIRDGKNLVIPSREVVPGDIVMLEAGDYICADGRIIENAGMKINESALTGESLSVEKEDLPIEGEVALGDRKNMVFSGSYVTYGRGAFVVSETGMNTEVGKIAQLMKNTSESRTPLQVSLDQFGKKLSLLILIICGVVFLLSVLRGEKIMSAFLFAVALAVAAIPEALSSIVTIVLAFGTKKMVKEHVIIRKLQAVEGLGSVSVICSDKTGTLTQNKMTVMQYFCDGQVTDCSSSFPEVSGTTAEKLIDFGVLCSDAIEEGDTAIGDPTEIALVHLSSDFGKDPAETRSRFPRLGEVPFDSDRKLMSTVNTYKGEQICITKGAEDVMIDRVASVETPEGIVPVTDEFRQRIQEETLHFSEQGLRVLAFAYKPVSDCNITMEDEMDLIFVGLVAMMDPPRVESADAVATCISAGIRPVMITGDHKITAAAIARKIGILTEDRKVVEGAELDALSDEQLEDFVEDVAVYARVSPEHKIRIVRAWQRKGNIVSMTGDGVNDAPALKQADVGVAMGITGSDVAKDAASMILTDDNFASIVKAVENGRNVYANIKKSIQFLLSGNMAGILAVLYACIVGFAAPFAAVHLLFINLLTDSLPAIALGLEPHSHEVMEERPRPKNESILTGDFVKVIFIQGIVIGAMTMIAYHIGLTESEACARTMAFATLCLSRLVHGFNSKAAVPVIFTKRFFDNRYLIGAFFIGLLLLCAVLLIPPLQGVFQVVPLDWFKLLMIFVLAVANLFIIQAIKAILHRKKNK